MPGANVDHRGTTFDEALLRELLLPLRDPHTGAARIAEARFTSAEFTTDARFNKTTFSTRAWFNHATFMGEATFLGAKFNGSAWFTGAAFNANALFADATFADEASFTNAKFNAPAHFRGGTFDGKISFTSVTFVDDAWFTEAEFNGDALFVGATFTSVGWFNGAIFVADAMFSNVTFGANANFMNAKFVANAWFGGAMFKRDAVFFRARFDGAMSFGPMVAHGSVNLSAAVFAVPVTVELAAARVLCMRTQWTATAILRCRFADIDLTDAVLTAPLAVMAHHSRFTVPRGDGQTELDEADLVATVSDQKVRLSSIGGVDGTHLVLTDVDLAGCRFNGAFHLDKLRLEGNITFAVPPANRRWWTLRYSRRRTLVEEHYWRSTRFPARGWQAAPVSESSAIGPGQIATLYRSLRATLESRGDAPGAADFYYGEMEMRRRDATTTRPERGLLRAYWLLSGYGLRASRALAWLLLAMIATVFALVLWGIPGSTAGPVTSGAINGDTFTLHTVSIAPVLADPWPARINADRAEQAVPIVLNAVLFRATDQNLTAHGTYIEMFARLVEPSLLALAVLAIRGRVKR